MFLFIIKVIANHINLKKHFPKYCMIIISLVANRTYRTTTLNISENLNFAVLKYVSIKVECGLFFDFSAPELFR